MTIIEQINEGIKETMRNKNMFKLGVLRMLKSKILAVDARAALPDFEVIKLFKTYYGNLEEALELATAAHRIDAAEQLKAELVIIQEFLPKALSLEATQEVVKEAIIASGAKNKKDLGKVMKHVMQRNLTVDSKLVRDLIDQQLMD